MDAYRFACLFCGVIGSFSSESQSPAHDALLRDTALRQILPSPSSIRNLRGSGRFLESFMQSPWKPAFLQTALSIVTERNKEPETHSTRDEAITALASSASLAIAGDNPSTDFRNVNALEGNAANNSESSDSSKNELVLPMMSFIEGSTSGNAAANETQAVGQHLSGLFDDIRFAVVRIQAIVAQMDLLEPYRQASDAPAVGSGFIVDQGGDDIIILTNAHVVSDAALVQVQLPALGQVIFDAFVPLICKTFDLAVVQLKRPRELLTALHHSNASLHALKMQPREVVLGMEVAAVGFPLGSSSLKLSRGVISGTENVDNKICYQTTAPISPGNSGGPLFALPSGEAPEKATGLQVIGINFASSSSKEAQNINYVVPAIHLTQILQEFRLFKKRQENASNMSSSVVQVGMNSSNGTHMVSEQYPHYQVRIAPTDIIGSESNDALFNTSGGCTTGYFVSRVEHSSALRFAQPPILPRSFVIAVDNVWVDNFGLGRTKNFLGDPTFIESLMTAKENLDEPVSLKVCRGGQVTTHVVSLRWRPEYNLGIMEIEEPYYEKQSLDFEIFAGVTLMQMSVNHVLEFLVRGTSPTLNRWLLMENRLTPRLIVTHIDDGSYASRVLMPGMTVETINDKNVSTLADFRRHFEPNGLPWTLETDQGVYFSVMFKEELAKQAVASKVGRPYLNTPAIKKAIKTLMLESESSAMQARGEARSSNPPRDEIAINSLEALPDILKMQVPVVHDTVADAQAVRSSRGFLARSSTQNSNSGMVLTQLRRMVSDIKS